ncbi:MAG TPA: methyltransferase domain-containing protein [Pseudonocardia sp.]|uniref:class I SAM-dependent methyltransferase n=1 Tax=Pseudonocardia sp. TaxID=60912 RepID=UPI002EDB0D69
MTTSARAVDQERVGEFARRVFGLYSSGLLTYMIDLGNRTGLFAAAEQGPATAATLAERAGVRERYVREWLGAMVTGEIMAYDPASQTYTLPAEHAACLAGTGSTNMAPMAAMVTHLGKHLTELEHAFRAGGGVPYSAFRPEFTGAMDQLNRRALDELLVSAWLPLVPGLAERLEAGARVADVGCGSGHALVVLAAAFPRSTFVGFDIAEDALQLGRTEAAQAGLTNLTFEVADVAALDVQDRFDAVFAIDAVHDQVDPAEVLRRVHGALAPGGTFVMVDMAASSNLEDNLGNPSAPWIYSVSTLHCLTVSLANNGAGLGAAWGEQTARRMLREAGFSEIVTHPAPGLTRNIIYVTRRAS